MLIDCVFSIPTPEFSTAILQSLNLWKSTTQMLSNSSKNLGKSFMFNKNLCRWIFLQNRYLYGNDSCSIKSRMKWIFYGLFELLLSDRQKKSFLLILCSNFNMNWEILGNTFNIFWLWKFFDEKRDFKILTKKFRKTKFMTFYYEICRMHMTRNSFSWK